MDILKVVVILTLVATSVPVQARGKLLLLQSYVHRPSQEQHKHLDLLKHNLGHRALEETRLRAVVESRLSRPGGTSGRPARAIQKQVKDGRRQFVDGNFRRAIQLLESARGDLLASEARVASNQDLRNSLHMALMMLAHSYLRMREIQKATTMISEVIRSFPDRDLSLITYSPELVQFYKKVRLQLRKLQRGTLTITTRPARCLVFINGRYLGTSPVRARALLPGLYRVYVQRPQQPGRVHLVTMDGADRELVIDFKLDRILRTRPHLALQFANLQQMKKDEVRQAVSVARAVGADQVLIAGFRHAGCQVLQGTLVSTDTAQVVRSGVVSMEPAAPSPQTIGSFARFLHSGQQGEEKWRSRCVLKPPVKQGRAPDHGQTSWISVVKWVALGTAVAGLGAGIPLLAMDGEPNCDAGPGDRCPGYYDTLGLGVVSTVVGGVAAVGTVVLFILDARARKRNNRAVGFSPLLLHQGAGLSATIRF